MDGSREWNRCGWLRLRGRKTAPIKLLESPIPAPPPTATPSQKAHFDNISGTKRGSIDPLVSKRPEKNSE